MIATRVALSSGESFYVDAEIEHVQAAIEDVVYLPSTNSHKLVAIGGRYVNVSQVTQITVEEMSSIHIPENLEAGYDASGD